MNALLHILAQLQAEWDAAEAAAPGMLPDPRPTALGTLRGMAGVLLALAMIVLVPWVVQP